MENENMEVLETPEVLEITLDDRTYPLAVTLRVAFNIQKAFGHKPYMEIFKNFDSMVLEDQVTILYEALKLANPNVPYTSTQFLNYLLDNVGVIEITDLVAGVVERIMYGGLTAEEVEQKKAKRQQTATR